MLGMRAGAVLELERLLQDSNPVLVQKAYAALQRLASDDSKQVSTTAAACLARQRSLPGNDQPAPQEAMPSQETNHPPVDSTETQDSLPLPLVSVPQKGGRPAWLFPVFGIAGLLLLGYLILNAAGKLPSAQPNPTATVEALDIMVTTPPVVASAETQQPVFTLTVRTADPCEGATTSGARDRFTFEQIVPCLDTVQKVSEFMQNNIIGDGYYDLNEHGGNEYAPPDLVYERGIDDCDGLATLQCYFLERNGMDAAMLGLSVDTPVGYNVCGVQMEGGTLILDGLGMILGPFPSNKEIADFYIKQGMMLPNGTLKSIKASQITQITTDFSTPTVLGLAWLSLEY